VVARAFVTTAQSLSLDEFFDQSLSTSTSSGETGTAYNAY
jgi:hypothetical protein